MNILLDIYMIMTIIIHLFSGKQTSHTRRTFLAIMQRLQVRMLEYRSERKHFWDFIVISGGSSPLGNSAKWT